MDEYSILKKKPKKNAFAATALLISIAIALLVMVGAVLVLGKVNDNDHIAANDNSSVEKENKKDDSACEGFVKERVFNENVKTIKDAAISYFTNERLPKEVGDTVKITLQAMKEKKLVLSILDASANKCDGNKSYVEVTKEENEYVMKIFLSCSDLEDYILVHLGCYDYCDGDVCEKEKEPEPEKVFEYEYKKTTACVMSNWSNWGPWKTVREKTSSLKKEDIKTETSKKEVTDTIDAIANTSYNCDKYPDYVREGTKCVKETTVTDTKDATPSEYSYNCDKYPGYDLVGTKCKKTTTVKDEKDADKEIIYTCPVGYKVNGKLCERTVTKTVIISATRNCPDDYKLEGTKCTKKITNTLEETATRTCPKDYKLDGTKCKKTVGGTSTQQAEPIYSTRTKIISTTCNEQECTTQPVFSCPTGKPCGMYPETSCQNVSKPCTKEVPEQYVSGYKCPDSSYTLSGTTCSKSTTTTDTKDSTLVCPDDYKLEGTTCKKTVTTTDTKDSTLSCPTDYKYKLDGENCVRTYKEKEDFDATENPKYSCPKDYTLKDKKCYKETKVTDTKEATKVEGGYVCPDGYTQNDKTCTKVTVTKDEKDADSKVTYSCPVGYTQNDKSCSKKSTETIKKTYYRYATRTCNGGSVDIKWSTSKNDSILKAEGYKLTGNKREVQEVIK